MGNYRFRLANMMPNAWFYKLKEMSRGSRGHSFPKSKNRSHPPRATTTTTTTPKPTLQPKKFYLPNRTSYYFPSRERPLQLSNSPIHPKASDTNFPIDPPRKSNKCRRPVKTSAKLVSSSVASACTCRTALGCVCKSDSLPQILPQHQMGNDDLRKPIVADFAEFNGVEPWSESCNCRASSSSADIIMDMDTKSSFDFDTAPELDLPPILTKPTTKFATKGGFDGSKLTSEQESYKNGVSLNTHKSPSRKTQQGIHRIKIRMSSPRLVSKRVEANQRSKTATGSKVAMQQRKGIIESFAIVKSSSDPQRDFKESMMEMILENNIQSSKDLEELLACYLSLNSEEYHDVIVKVFKQIWCDITNIRF